VETEPVTNHISVEPEQGIEESVDEKTRGDGRLADIPMMSSMTPPPLLDDDENSEDSADKEDRYKGKFQLILVEYVSAFRIGLA